MKKNYLALTLIASMIIIQACSNGSSKSVVETTTGAAAEVVETTKPADTANEIKESVTRMDRRAEFAFDASKKFVYTGNEKYLKVVCEEMIKVFDNSYDTQGIVCVPTPYVVKVDDSDKNDIKIYGDFYIYGYKMDGMIFDMENGGSYPGCYHLKDEDGNISFVSSDIALDGSEFDKSLKKICDNDEELYKKICSVVSDDDEKTRIEYVKMYAKNNNLDVCGIKDFGWPVILFDDISDAKFLYNFYDAYMNEIRQDDVLNNLPERIDNLRKAYMTPNVIKKIEDNLMDGDIFIGAQDVTESMLDTLQINDFGSGNLTANMNAGTEDTFILNVKIEKSNGKKMITNIE